MAEKTEEPTQKKLDDARKEGNIARSKELSDAVMMLSVIAYFLFNGQNLLQGLRNLFRIAGQCPLGIGMEISCIHHVIARLLHEFWAQMLPFFIIILIVPILVEVGQIGFIFTSERIKPSFKKFDVITNVKNIFSKKTLVTLLKMSLSTTVCPFIIWKTLQSGYNDILNAVSMGMGAVFLTGLELLKRECFYMLLFFFVLAVLDFIWEKYSKHKELKMTKEEVKQEMKDDQGNPEIRSRRREVHQEILSGDAPMEPDVASASAVVTNPDHYAVALYYDKLKTPLPIIMAKGKNEVAEWIIKVALKYDIPILRNVPLARGLMFHPHAKLYRLIPFEFLEPVAEVLKIVRDMRCEEKLKQSTEIDITEEW